MFLANNVLSPAGNKSSFLEEHCENHEFAFSKKPLTCVSKRVIGAHGKRSLERGWQKSWQRVGERLAKGWYMFGEGLAEGWQRVPCTLQLCNSRNARWQERVCDSMDSTYKRHGFLLIRPYKRREWRKWQVALQQIHGVPKAGVQPWRQGLRKLKTILQLCSGFPAMVFSDIDEHAGWVPYNLAAPKKRLWGQFDRWLAQKCVLKFLSELWFGIWNIRSASWWEILGGTCYLPRGGFRNFGANFGANLGENFGNFVKNFCVSFWKLRSAEGRC